MTHYTEGAIISRELEQMMHDYAAEARFDRELADDLELFTERKQRQQNTFEVVIK
jgi:vacuolar-type H+-ATPase catalytic subunit A/Vma1